MTQAFMEAHEFTVRWEKGLQNFNLTIQKNHKYGFSKHWFNELQQHYAQLEKSSLPIEITPELVAKLMHDFLWKPLRCADIPKALSVVLYDSAVHMGSVEAVKIVQKSCNTVGEAYLDTFHPCKCDGIIGKKTLSLAIDLANFNLDFYTARMAIRQRVQHYTKASQNEFLLQPHWLY